MCQSNLIMGDIQYQHGEVTAGEEAFFRPPYHGLRHPFIFYYSHVAGGHKSRAHRFIIDDLLLSTTFPVRAQSLPARHFISADGRGSYAFTCCKLQHGHHAPVVISVRATATFWFMQAGLGLHGLGKCSAQPLVVTGGKATPPA